MRHLGLVSLLSLFMTIPALAQDDDVGRATEAVCCGANCCRIAGVCTSRDEQNPANECEVCDPSSSQFEWTNVCDGGAAPDGGPVGPPDGGAGGVDAAIALVDAGPIVTPMDAGGGGGTDAGTPDDTDGGCSIGATRGSSLSALALVAALGLAARRRR